MFPYAALAQTVIGGVQAGISAAKAAKLPEPQKHTVSPELRTAYNMSRRRADEGYSAEEKSAFEQMMGRQSTFAKRMFQNVGLAGAGSAAANIMGIDALNQFAAHGASIKRANFGQFANMAGEIQSVRNLETNRFNQQLNAQEQALGGGIQAGIGNMFGGLQSGMNFNQNEQAINAYKGMGQGGEINPYNAQLPQAPMGTGSGVGQNGFPVSTAPSSSPQAPTGMYGFNPNFKPSGMGAYGPQPNMGYMPLQLNQKFQGYGMGLYP